MIRKFLLALSLIACTAELCYAQSIPADSTLKEYWDLDETSGTRIASHNGHNLADSGSTGSTTGKLGNAADFAGSTILSVTDHADFNMTNDSDLVVACWIRLDNKSGDHYAVSKWNFTGDQRQFLLGYRLSDDRFVLGISSDGSSAAQVFYAAPVPIINSPVADGTVWYHLAGVRRESGDEVEMYINGSSVGTTTGTNPAPADKTGDVVVGGVHGNAFGAMAGDVDEAGIWIGWAATDADIALLAADPPPAYPFSGGASPMLLRIMTENNGLGFVRPLHRRIDHFYAIAP